MSVRMSLERFSWERATQGPQTEKERGSRPRFVPLCFQTTVWQTAPMTPTAMPSPPWLTGSSNQKPKYTLLSSSWCYRVLDKDSRQRHQKWWRCSWDLGCPSQMSMCWKLFASWEMAGPWAAGPPPFEHWDGRHAAPSPAHAAVLLL